MRHVLAVQLRQCHFETCFPYFFALSFDQLVPSIKIKIPPASPEYYHKSHPRFLGANVSFWNALDLFNWGMCGGYLTSLIYHFSCKCFGNGKVIFGVIPIT